MRIAGIIIAFLIIVAVSGCISNDEPEAPVSSPDQTQVSADTRESAEAGVTVTAVYIGNYAFEVKLDTHSGSLDYDMAALSYIRDRKGTIVKPESWDGGIGGHHFEGNLKFPKFDDSAGFELVIQDVAGVKERILKW